MAPESTNRIHKFLDRRQPRTACTTTKGGFGSDFERSAMRVEVMRPEVAGGKRSLPVSVKVLSPLAFESLIKRKMSFLAMGSENRELHAALSAKKLEVMDALARVVQATHEMFGMVEADVDVDPESPSDRYVVLAVSTNKKGADRLGDRLTWREKIASISGGLFDQIRLHIDGR